MSVVIHKNDSDKAIRDAIKKVADRKKKKSINLDRYFGKVSFDMGGLKFQKSVRDEWQ